MKSEPLERRDQEDLRGEASLRGRKVLQCFALWKETEDLG